MHVERVIGREGVQGSIAQQTSPDRMQIHILTSYEASCLDSNGNITLLVHSQICSWVYWV